MYTYFPVLGRGDAFTQATLEQMHGLVRRALCDGDFIRHATYVVRGVNGRDSLQLASRIRGWMSSSLAFLRDPAVDGDVLRDPSYVLRDIRTQGQARVDCDDAAVFGAALGRAVGLEARFVVVAFGSKREPFSHVWAELQTERGWVDLDVTAPPGLRGRIPVTRRAIAPA